FAGGGKKRSAVWGAAKRVADAAGWINDPAAAAWNAGVRVRGELVEVTLEPWGLADPRFAYRKRTVKAASHPTIAAALARIAGALGLRVARSTKIEMGCLGTEIQVLEKPAS